MIYSPATRRTARSARSRRRVHLANCWPAVCPRAFTCWSPTRPSLPELSTSPVIWWWKLGFSWWSTSIFTFPPERRCTWPPIASQTVVSQIARWQRKSVTVRSIVCPGWSAPAADVGPLLPRFRWSFSGRCNHSVSQSRLGPTLYYIQLLLARGHSARGHRGLSADFVTTPPPLLQ